MINKNASVILINGLFDS